MKTIKTGVIGLGFIGPAHVEAVRRIGGAEVVAVADINQPAAKAYAAAHGIPKVYGDYREMLKDDSIEVVHNCTPNNMHYDVNCAVIARDKHIVSEKPLAMSSAESRKLVKIAAKSGLVNAVNFNYRHHPLMQQAATMVRKKQLGDVFAVHGCYTQDWLLYDTDWNWRISPKMGGPSRAIADIGSHWFDLTQYLTGKRIVKVCADLFRLHNHRKKPKGEVASFEGKTLRPSQYTKVRVTSEGYGHIMVEYDDGARGMVCVSQLSAGRKNHIFVEIDGTKQAIWWDQERPNELVIGHRNEPNEILLKDPALMDKDVRDCAHYPGGHNEGYPTCIKNLFANVYRSVRNRRRKVDYPTFEDGHVANAIVDAVLASDKSKSWRNVKY